MIASWLRDYGLGRGREIDGSKRVCLMPKTTIFLVSSAFLLDLE